MSISPSLCAGVPKSRRGEVWLLLSHQHRLRHRLPQRQQAPDTPYHDLLKQLTAQQHAILVDLGVHTLVKKCPHGHGEQRKVVEFECYVF